MGFANGRKGETASLDGLELQGETNHLLAYRLEYKIYSQIRNKPSPSALAQANPQVKTSRKVTCDLYFHREVVSESLASFGLTLP